MQIMCLNGWGGRVHGPLIDYLASAQPDVLCLQEVVHAPDSDQPWLDFRDDGAELPQRAQFFAEVGDALPQHQAIFCPAARGNLFHGESAYSSLWGQATYVHKRLPIIAQHQDFVHGAFSPDGFGEHPRSRTGHAVRLFDADLGGPVTIAHMHGLRDPAGKHDTPERLDQAKRLAAMVLSVAEDGDRIVVCGDFNVLPDSATFDIFAGLGMTDLVTARGFSSTRTSLYKKPVRFADYMLVNDRLRDAAFDIVTDPEVSDHTPLVLTI